MSDVDDLFEEITEDVRLRVGGGVALAPSFEGDNDYKARFFPQISLRWRDRVALSNTRLQVVAWKSKTVRAGALAQYRFGRDENDDSELMGLGDIGDSFELGGFVEWRPSWFALGGDIAFDAAGGHGGAIASFWTGAAIPLSEQWSASVGARISWVNGNYMRDYFGVTPAQSAASGLPVYDAGSGFKDVGVRFKIRYKPSKRWRLSSSVAYQRLLGDAANSPLVQQRGDPNQIIWSFSIDYNI